MEIEKININSLIPSDYNPRIMSDSEMLKLSKNMEQFGLVDPIIINLKNNHIIGGHQRFNILCNKYENNTSLNLIRLGDIGWVFENKELTIENIEHEKALNLSLNSLDGEFDKDGLGALLSDLQHKNFDLELTGFDDFEILDYTLDYELNTITDENINLNENTTEKADVELPKNDITINIKFSSPKQRKKFINFIEKIKQAKPEKTITQNITQYIHEHHTDTHTKKTPDYNILFTNETEKKKFKQLYKKLEHDYYKDPLLNFIDEHE